MQLWRRVRFIEMCGRYTLIRLAEFLDVFPWIGAPDQPARPRYNIAPSQPILAVANDGKNKLQMFQWGLVPSWAKDPSIGNKMINARAETLAAKPAYRAAFRRRRCAIPADGFYEWRKEPDGKTKTPMYIRRRDHQPFAFAGLWEIWHSDDGTELPTCTIITGPPNELMKSIHDRMPAILSPDAMKRWLDPKERPPEELISLLGIYPDDEMEANPVSRAVNNPRVDSPECVESITEPIPPTIKPPPIKSPPIKSPKPKSRRGNSDQPTLF
jgi:putative SOS response-associated peptidase YedK